MKSVTEKLHYLNTKLNPNLLQYSRSSSASFSIGRWVTGYSENGRKQAKTTENQRKRLNVTAFPTVLLHMLM